MKTAKELFHSGDYEDAPPDHVLTREDVVHFKWTDYYDNVVGLAGNTPDEYPNCRFRRPKQKAAKVETEMTNEKWRSMTLIERAWYNKSAIDHWMAGGEVESEWKGRWTVDKTPSLTVLPLRIKPKPPEPRKVWVVYKDGVVHCVRDNKLNADDYALLWAHTVDEWSVVEFVEVMKGDSSVSE